jgi:hypothetical protein
LAGVDLQLIVMTFSPSPYTISFSSISGCFATTIRFLIHQTGFGSRPQTVYLAFLQPPSGCSILKLLRLHPSLRCDFGSGAQFTAFASTAVISVPSQKYGCWRGHCFAAYILSVLPAVFSADSLFIAFRGATTVLHIH